MNPVQKRGALIVHGLTATPAVMAPTIEAMEEAGYLVSAPLLPGHGTTEHDLEQTPWQAWVAAVQDATADLARRCGSIYYIGHSLGALLGLYLAATVTPAKAPGSSTSGCRVKPGMTKHKLRALALMATPLHLSPAIQKILPVVRYSFVRWLYNFSAKDWSGAVTDPEGLEIYRESSYPRIPVKSVYQVCDLEKVVRSRLGDIHIPTLLIHSRRDDTAPPSNVTELEKSLRNPSPEILWLEKSGHVIPLDVEHDRVTQSIIQFFERIRA